MSEDAIYHVVDPQGATYGPVDLEGLRGWVGEGRVGPDTIIWNEASGVRLQAKFVKGLFAEGAAMKVPPIQMPPPPSEAPPPRKSSGSIWGLVIGMLALAAIGVCGIGAAIVFPVFSQAKISAKRAMALSNLKQLSLGVIMYSTDWDDRFPLQTDSALSMAPYIDPYVKNATLYRSVNPAGGTILGNPALAGHSTTELATPATTVLFYDSLPWPNNKAVASFTDGSAKATLIYSDILSMLAKKPFFPPKKPAGRPGPRSSSRHP